MKRHEIEKMTDEGARNLASAVILSAIKDARVAVRVLESIGIRNHEPEHIKEHLEKKYKGGEVDAKKYMIPDAAIDGLFFMVDEGSDLYFDMLGQERDGAIVDRYLLLLRQSITVKRFFDRLARDQKSGVVPKHGVSAMAAAKMLGMSKSQIYKHANNGMPYSIVGGKMKFDLKKCENWLIDRNYV